MGVILVCGAKCRFLSARSRIRLRPSSFVGGSPPSTEPDKVFGADGRDEHGRDGSVRCVIVLAGWFNPMGANVRVHGCCAARDGAGVLILGPSGAGKSDLTLRLLSRGFTLVADDQVDIADGRARAPASLAGLLEVRGLGIVRLPYQSDVKLHLVIALTEHADRLPRPEPHPGLDLPVVRLNASEASAPERVALALDCALGRVTQYAGAFAA